MNFYIVSFDRPLGTSYKNFHDAFTKSNGFTIWWHYIKSSYIIGTNKLSASEISALFVSCAKETKVPTTHIVVKIDPNERQGMLPKDAWNWFKENSKK